MNYMNYLEPHSECNVCIDENNNFYRYRPKICTDVFGIIPISEHNIHILSCNDGNYVNKYTCSREYVLDLIEHLVLIENKILKFTKKSVKIKGCKRGFYKDYSSKYFKYNVEERKCNNPIVTIYFDNYENELFKFDIGWLISLILMLKQGIQNEFT